MVKLENVNKYFYRRKKNEIHIINNTSLELEDKGLVAILGQSGCGKTTLLNAISGLDKVNNGKIFVNGKRITKKRSSAIDKIRNLNIGYIFQDYKLIENMSVFDNIAISLRMLGLKNKEEIKRRVEYVLEAVGMYRYRNRPAQMLSGGEKQRVAIARAIVKNPNIVIADEPTGNLDSKNSLEIMNIIKAISREKLVILVTHEVDLATFFATRIIEVKDGKIEKDYINSEQESLEYKIENKIYLKDFEKIDNFQNEKLNVNIYSDEEKSKLNIDLVIKNGNIFIKTDNKKVEVVDENSSIEFVNAHYKKIDKSIYKEQSYNLNTLSNEKFKPKHSSIYGILKSIKTGFTRILNYTTLKKILLLGFLASAMFVVYGVCNIAGTIEIRESDYMTVNSNYLKAEIAKVNIEDYLQYEKENDIDYIIPGDSYVTFVFKMNDFYQTSRKDYPITGSMVDINKITQEDLILGKMPQNQYELVLDRAIIDKMLKDEYSSFNGSGIKSYEELLNKKLIINGMNDFTIVGFTNNISQSIYLYKEQFINVLNNMSSGYYGMYSSYDSYEYEKNNVKDYNLYLDDITITKGRLPENDYEVILNNTYADMYKINSKIKEEVNGTQLTVVGFYTSKSKKNDYLVNNNTVKYNIISTTNGFTICPKDKTTVYNRYREEYRINLVDVNQQNKEQYVYKKQEEIKSAVIFACVMLGISLIEIYLMIRSSFLSRIKEVGILRAIGLKKMDIYRMFMGEIFAITTIASMPGVALMTYILKQVTSVSYISRMFAVNIVTIGICIIVLYVFNFVIGLLPLYKVLRKTPAQILARHDLE